MIEESKLKIKIDFGKIIKLFKRKDDIILKCKHTLILFIYLFKRCIFGHFIFLKTYFEQ